MIFRDRIPEITPEKVAEKQKSEEQFVLLDVREQREFEIAQIDDPRSCLVPLTQLAAMGVEALPEYVKNKNKEVVVFCHLGSRSTQVVDWLQQNGWENVWNMSGGIDAYSRSINPNIQRY